MNDQVVSALTSLIKEGGHIALWGIFIYYTLKLLTVCAIGGFVWLAIRTLSVSLVRFSAAHMVLRERNLSILSQEASSAVTNSLDNFIKEVERVVKDLEKQSRTSSSDSPKQ